MAAKLSIRKVINYPPMLAIRFYRRFISPLFPPCCRFHPSCSAYALECFRELNPFKALWFTIWRIMRCNPFNRGGYDPPPRADGCVPTEEDAET